MAIQYQTTIRGSHATSFREPEIEKQQWRGGDFVNVECVIGLISLHSRACGKASQSGSR